MSESDEWGQSLTGYKVLNLNIIFSVENKIENQVDTPV